MHAESQIREPLILGNKTYRNISDDIIAPIEGKANRLWYILFTISSLAFMWGIGCLSYTIGVGIGAWGSNNGDRKSVV